VREQIDIEVNAFSRRFIYHSKENHGKYKPDRLQDIKWKMKKCSNIFWLNLI